MTYLWEHDETAADNLRIALGQAMRTVESGPSAVRALVDDRNEQLLVIGPDIDLTSALNVSEQLRLERPELGVILLRRRLEVGVLSQALRAGVREVVAADDLSALIEACQRSRDLSARLGGVAGASSHEGRVVTVFAAKGGCGKTTVSTNVAAELASQTNRRVLLVDLDLAFGDVAISLGLMPERTMADLVAMAGHLDEQGLASVVTHHECGLDVLCAPPHPGDADRIPSELVSEMLRIAKRVYDVVVVDTPPAFTEHVLASFDASDVSLLLATLDIPSVKNLRMALETLDLLGHPKETRLLVLNRADSKVGLSVGDVEAAVHARIDCRIPDNRAVTSATNRGTPIVLLEPKHVVSTALRELAHDHIGVRVAADETGADGYAQQAPHPASGGFRLFRRSDARS